MNWLSKLWSLFKSYFLPCAQSATDAAEEAGVISKDTAAEIDEVIEGIGALDKIVSRSLELIGGGIGENSILGPDDTEKEEKDGEQTTGDGSIESAPEPGQPEQQSSDQPNP